MLLDADLLVTRAKKGDVDLEPSPICLQLDYRATTAIHGSDEGDVALVGTRGDPHAVVLLDDLGRLLILLNGLWRLLLFRLDGFGRLLRLLDDWPPGFPPVVSR